MGCSGSKVDDLPLVVRCRERRELIRSAANHRYALAAAHVSYFTSLKDVGDALRKFVDEELVTASNSSSSSLSSPSLSLPPNSKVKSENGDESQHSHEDAKSRINLHDSSSSSDGDLEDDYNHEHNEPHDSDNGHKGFNFGAKNSHNVDESSSHYPSNFYGFSDISMHNPFIDPFYPLPTRSHYYMKKSAPEMKTVIQDPPARPVYGYSDSYWNSPGNYGGDYRYFPMSIKVSPRKEGPPPPSPPNVSAWDFFNPFDVFDGGYEGYGYGHDYGSDPHSPDSGELREREGIPDLEEETENEVQKNESSSKSVHSGSSSSISTNESENPSKAQSPDMDIESSISLKEEKSSSETLVSKSVDGNSVKKKEEADSCRVSSVTMLSSPRGPRDLCEVVAEIRDDFEVASSYGKEVAMLLEVGKLPYQPGFLKVILSRILYLVGPSPTLRDSSSMQSVKLASRSMKLAKSYFEDFGMDVDARVCDLSSTLEKLYAWEKKLCKEVKDEERLRVLYEKQCRRLKVLDEKGVDSSKTSATRAFIRRLLTKLDVSIKAIDVISNRINKLRDEELQPNLDALIHGLIRMWKAMLKCHQKQFQAIMESKMRKLKATTSLQTEPNLRATTELEKSLQLWCQHFNNWIKFQKSYIDSLNSWLLQCLQFEQNETLNGRPISYSPAHLGAPPVFIICNDWQRAMEALSEGKVLNSMNALVTSLQQLWEKQDEEERQRVKAEYILKAYEKMGRDSDQALDRTGFSVVPSEDDMKLDLNSLRRKLAEERRKHKDAMKLVRDAASRSLKVGLVPVFKALENFSCEALKAHEHVRLLKLPQENS